MKTVFNLARNLRVFFGVAKIINALVGIPLLLVWFILSFLPPSSVRPAFIMPLFDVQVQLPEDSVGKKSVSDDRGFLIATLKADLLLNFRSTDVRLNRSIRYIALPAHFVTFIFLWISLGLLRDLCARAEKGEIFNDVNLRSVRNLGALFLAGVIVDGTSSLVLKLYLSPHLPQLSLPGSNLALKLEWDYFTYIIDFVTGLLVLLIAEAFRQGLALKKEHELTV